MGNCVVEMVNVMMKINAFVTSTTLEWIVVRDIAIKTVRIMVYAKTVYVIVLKDIVGHIVI